MIDMKRLLLSLILVMAISGCVDLPTGGVLGTRASSHIQQLIEKDPGATVLCGNGICEHTRILKDKENTIIDIYGESYNITIAGLVNESIAVIRINDDLKTVDIRQPAQVGRIAVYVDDIHCCQESDRQAKLYIIENPVICPQDCK